MDDPRPACFFCVTEMCGHKQSGPGVMRHPHPGKQPKAITALHGTPLCGACAIDQGQTMLLKAQAAALGATDGS